MKFDIFLIKGEKEYYVKLLKKREKCDSIYISSTLIPEFYTIQMQHK